MEPFVRRLVAGGLALFAGLWLMALLEPRGAGWLLGPLLVLAGVGSLASGIASQIEWPVRD